MPSASRVGSRRGFRALSIIEWRRRLAEAEAEPTTGQQLEARSPVSSKSAPGRRGRCAPRSATRSRRWRRRKPTRGHPPPSLPPCPWL